MKKVLFILLVVVLSAYKVEAQNTIEGNNAFARGNNYYNRKDYRNAILEYAKVVQINPRNTNLPFIYNRIGYMYSNGLGYTKNKEKAIHYYTLAANRGNEQAKKNLAILNYNSMQAQQRSQQKAYGVTQQRTYGVNQQRMYSGSQPQPYGSNYNGDTYQQIYRQAVFQSLDQSKYPKNSGVTHVVPQRNMGLALDGTLYYDSYGNVMPRSFGSANSTPSRNIDKTRFHKNQDRLLRLKGLSQKNPNGVNNRAYNNAKRNNQQLYRNR